MRAEYIEKAETDPSYLVLEFDYGQNYPLPMLNVSAQFYCRLLWLYVFNVHILNQGKSYMYCFLENQGKKDANSVVSLVFDCLQKTVTPQVTNIVFFSDGCGGQNKNAVMVKFSAWVSKYFNVTVEHLFPVRGHSFSQCDLNFGLVRKKEKNLEVVSTSKPY